MDIIQKILENKKIFGICCGLLIVVAIIGAVTDTNNNSTVTSIEDDNENLFNTSISISTSGWDYSPDGFNLIGDEVYGSCEGVTPDGVEHTYFFTDEQMAALGNISDYTFKYNDLHIIAEKNDKGNMIVKHIFYKNGTEISYDWNVYDFRVYSKVAGANNPNCVDGFGFSDDEL